MQRTDHVFESYLPITRVIPDAESLMSQRKKKRLSASEVRFAIDVQLMYSLFVSEGAEGMRSHVQQTEALAKKSLGAPHDSKRCIHFLCLRNKNFTDNRTTATPKRTKIEY